ncbi:hypothetical protein HWV62_35434 [Athelia sp. TMB]|nr:hypothetical protein HWV62_35434 [Athelia sp. TMB]
MPPTPIARAGPFTDITNTLADPPAPPRADDDEIDLGTLRAPSRMGFLAPGDLPALCSGDELDALADTSFSLSDDSEESESESDDEEEGTLFTLFPPVPAPTCTKPTPLPKPTPLTTPTPLLLPKPEPPTRPPRPPLALALSPLAPHYAHPPSPAPPISSSARIPASTARAPEYTGLSRSALLHRKWLWAQRYEEWVLWEAEADEEPYGGMAVFPGPPPLRARSPSPPCSPPRLASPDANSKIHPRMGDLRALRTGAATGPDRALARWGVWTLRKALWMGDVHRRAGICTVEEAVHVHEQAPAVDIDITVTEVDSNDEDNEDDEDIDRGDALLSISLAALAAHPPSSSSDDLLGASPSDDATLCDSASDATAVSPCGSCFSSAKTRCSALPDDECVASPGSAYSDQCGDGDDGGGWAARWAFLAAAVPRGSGAYAPCAVPPPSPKARAAFFLSTSDEEDEDGDGDEWDSEDEEDYGRIVPNPVYARAGCGFLAAGGGGLVRGIDVRSGRPLALLR